MRGMCGAIAALSPFDGCGRAAGGAGAAGGARHLRSRASHTAASTCAPTRAPKATTTPPPAEPAVPTTPMRRNGSPNCARAPTLRDSLQCVASHRRRRRSHRRRRRRQQRALRAHCRVEQRCRAGASVVVLCARRFDVPLLARAQCDDCACRARRLRVCGAHALLTTTTTTTTSMTDALRPKLLPRNEPGAAAALALSALLR
jgi:hypothetical protein